MCEEVDSDAINDDSENRRDPSAAKVKSDSSEPYIAICVVLQQGKGGNHSAWCRSILERRQIYIYKMYNNALSWVFIHVYMGRAIEEHGYYKSRADQTARRKTRSGQCDPLEFLPGLIY